MPTTQTHEELPDGDDVMFARTGVTDIFGKLDDELPPIRISGDVLDHMRRNARAAGVNFSEYVRNKLYVGEYGIEHIKSLREEQFMRVMGNAAVMPSIRGAK